MLQRVLLTIALVGMASTSTWGESPTIAAGKGDLLSLPPAYDQHRSAFDELSNETQAIHLLEDPGEYPLTARDFEAELRSNLRVIYTPIGSGYDWKRFSDHTSAIGWDVAGAYGIAGIIGFSEWDWGGSRFHITQEGWFGKETEYLGMDKLGHAYTGYLLSDYFTQRIAHSTADIPGAAVTGGLLGMGIQTYVELLDGFSKNGFSPEDFLADGLGVGFSILRNTVPGLANKLDFRMEYIPSGNEGAFEPYSDYSGQKYLLAVKLSGFEDFEDTPLQFIELQAGYYGRGFTEKEQEHGKKLRREPYVAIALNLGELLNETPARDETLGLLARRSLEYVQVPYTYLPSN